MTTKTSTNTYWRRREKTALAEALGISAQQMSDYIGKRKGVSPKRAKELENATRALFGEARAVPAEAWLGLTEHPALR